VLLYAATLQGLYRCQAVAHELQLAVTSDVRRVTGYQGSVDDAALDIVCVGDHGRMGIVPPAQRTAYACAVAGAMAQNVYLFCASVGLATVVRAWFDHDALAKAMGLGND
jgi:nitroreductase